MNDYFKKNINKIIGIFLLIQPFLDLLTGICIHRFKLNITIGIVVRIIFLLFICYVVIFVFKKKKLIIPYFIIGLYFILYFIGLKIFRDNTYLSEIQNLIKVFYFPILLISLYSIKEEIRISNLTLFIIIFFYLILIFVPILLNVGYKSYEITKTGTLGFFNSANEISGIISILTPFLFIIFYESKKIIPIIILTIMYLVVVLTMGTKTPILSLGITSLISIIYFWLYLLKNKKYKYIFISLVVIIVSCIGLILIIPKTSFYKNIRVHLDYLEVNQITDIFKDKKLVDHFIFSSRIKFLKNKSKIYKKSSVYEKLFGIGYINKNKKTKLIEMDYFDIYYSHGIIGFLIFIIIMIYVLYKVINKNKGYEQLMKNTSLFYILFLSLLTGHIITAPSVSLLSIIIILSLAKRTKKDLLFADKNMHIGGIEQAQVNLLNILDYNKYNVTLVLEEKEGEFLNKINKSVIIKELKVSNNKVVILRKIINIIRKLIFKIFNYHNYDFSCCYTTYSYSSNVLAKTASLNNSIYIHSDYKYVYKNEKDYKEFFDSRKVFEYKHIIFVSNESKESFLNYYPNLKDKTIVLNNFINVEEIKEKSEEIIDIEKNEKILFAFVGRLDDSSKKLKRAINLVNNLDIELWIIGDGPDKKMYEEFTQELKLKNRVKFLGKKINPYPYMKQADYIILTSDYEGFPVIYQEALILNKKIITTINTSDDQINMKDYAYIVSKKENEMVREVKEILSKKENKNQANIKNILEKRKNLLEKIINNQI